MVFEKTLTDLVKGIRASKRDTPLYISSCIAEIKSEINSTDPHVKANALQKLTFLQMMGYNMSWASFATIEVMSNTRFAYRRIGYLAASQTFTQDTEVTLLATNLLKKELRGAVGPGISGVYEAGLAINCLSNIATEDLARELLNDVTNLTTHPQPYLRKKAILCLFKLFLKYPQGLRLTFGSIQNCLLQDSSPSVTSCAVNVITELSDKNPKNYLVLAPTFFNLLTSSSNNWMLIKVVKLLGSLVSEEPRLARKLLDPLATIVQNTQAKSLLYEAVYTITLCLPYCRRKVDGTMPPNVPQIVNLCANVLKSFIEESDQNLKYLGLVGFASLMVSHPKILSTSTTAGEKDNRKSLILACLSDADVTIRTRALDLVSGGGLATKKNIVELVSQLLKHVDMAQGSYKVDLVEKILEICSFDKYSLLSDFCWYLDVLIILSRMRGLEGRISTRNGGVGRTYDLSSFTNSSATPNMAPQPYTQPSSYGGDSMDNPHHHNLGTFISGQILDVTLRVLPVRAYAVRRMIGILLKGKKEQEHSSVNKSTGSIVYYLLPEVLPSAGWIVGEYAALIDEGVSMSGEDVPDGDDEDELFQFDSTSKGTYHAIIQALTDPFMIDNTSYPTQRVFIQASMKVLASASISSKCSDDELEACISCLSINLPMFMQSMDSEIQERAFSAFKLLQSLDLIGSTERTPELVPIRTDDDTDTDSDDGKNMNIPLKNNNTSDDLLNLTTNASSTPSSIMNPSSSLMNINMNSISSKCRLASATLRYLFIPDPMKPISAKAQRKKRQDASNMMGSNGIDGPINIPVFQKLIDGEKSRFDANKSNQKSLEGITFTQQTNLRMIPVERKNSHNALDVFDSNINHQPGLVQKNNDQSLLTTTKPNDPFYLNSSKINAPDSPVNRFGTIMLVDSDDDSVESGKRRSQKKKKKQRKRDEKGKERNKSVLSPSMANANVGAVFPAVDVYHSDDDEPVNNQILTSRNKIKGVHSKEFAGLAKVDLTAPLREDEVMPRNEHRVVPVKKSPKASSSPGRKKPKKESKHKKKKEKSTERENLENDGTSKSADNLLDFTGLGTTAPSNSETATMISGDTKNAISEAFDDLLGLDLPSPTLTMQPMTSSIQAPPSFPGSEQSFAPKSKASSKLWQKVTMKYSSATNTKNIDWESITLLYRMHVSSNNSSFEISLKLINQSKDTTLSNIRISVNGVESQILIPDVPAASFSNSKKKIGPFSTTMKEIRGQLDVSGCNVPIKIVVPSTLSLAPLSGLSENEVTRLLYSSSEWFMNSVNIDVINSIDKLQIKELLKSFINAAEVNSDGLSSSRNSIFASQSNSGDKILFLMKISKNAVKVDIKSTASILAKTVSSDLKRAYI